MRITDFPELVTATGNDLLVTVDIANDLTKKIKLENLPTSIATTVALATKHNLLVSGTNIKTVNSTTLLGSGDIAVQETLVSGTNIKTLNSTSLLGSGNIVLAATPSGVAGAIQFSDGSAFASDATKFFWDDTNNRLGVGTNAPTATAHFKGSGSTSATTSLLVQNSAGTAALTVLDSLAATFGAALTSTGTFTSLSGIAAYSTIEGYSSSQSGSFAGAVRVGSVGNNNTTAILDVVSTTKGFLPPRMTTTQKNAIATPAAGLVVYDSTTNKLCCYNGSTWNDLF